MVETTTASTNTQPIEVADDRHISMRFSVDNKDLKEKLKKLAKSKKRPLNQFVELILADFVENPKSLFE